MRLSGLGMSWNNIRQMGQPKVQILPGTQVPDEKGGKEVTAFTQEDLELQWMSMCNRMPQQMSGMAARMKNMNPTLLEMPAVEVVVANELIKDELETIHGKILATLKHYLHNSDITLTIRVTEKQEQVKILTRKEQFELMSQQNPSVEKLREAFDLELA